MVKPFSSSIHPEPKPNKYSSELIWVNHSATCYGHWLLNITDIPTGKILKKKFNEADEDKAISFARNRFSCDLFFQQDKEKQEKFKRKQISRTFKV